MVQYCCRVGSFYLCLGLGFVLCTVCMCLYVLGTAHLGENIKKRWGSLKSRPHFDYRTLLIAKVCVCGFLVAVLLFLSELVRC